MSASRIVSIIETQSKSSLGRSSIYKGIKDGTFPKPIRLGARRIGFLEAEIDQWIETRIKASRQQVSA
jgi:prophage regulatory protein